MRARIIFAAATCAGLLACGASSPSKELKTARDTYNRARVSSAAQYAPTAVLEAKQSLDTAEQIHRNDPGSDIERSYAYIATRRAVHGHERRRVLALELLGERQAARVGRRRRDVLGAQHREVGGEQASRAAARREDAARVDVVVAHGAGRELIDQLEVATTEDGCSRQRVAARRSLERHQHATF